MTKSILLIMAHPDDAFVWCGGFIFSCLKLKSKINVLSLSKAEEDVEKNIEKLAEKHGFEYCSISKNEVDIDVISNILIKTQPDLIITHWFQDTHEYHRMTVNLTDTAIQKYKLDTYDKRNKSVNIRCLQCDTYYSLGTTGDPFPGKTIIDISSYFSEKIDILKVVSSKYINIIEPMIRVQGAFYGGKIGCEYAEAFLEYSSLASIGGGLGRMNTQSIIG
ncbi:MAG: hypothetical protein KKA10_13785 [Euryarchaeota archaeon]|nr:hypothetical protein [Euryarchaeota archaeon]MCG2736293.1 hypothetical protein [Candidatus Methanoperedenaceae archaeon]